MLLTATPKIKRIRHIPKDPYEQVYDISKLIGDDFEWTSTDIGPIPGSPQVDFLSTSADIALGGGSAGGGKSRCGLIEPLRHKNNPFFNAVIFRETYPQIFQQGSIWDESMAVYGLLPEATPVKSDPGWNFKKGMTVAMRHLDNVAQAKKDWQGSAPTYQYWDELTHFAEEIWWYIALSRARQTRAFVKPYVRAGCNPDPDSWVKRVWAPWVDDTDDMFPVPSGELLYFTREQGKIKWVDKKWINPKTGLPAKSITFIRMSVFDNKVLLKENPEYIEGLYSLPLVDQRRLLYGDWNIRLSGNMFKEEWTEYLYNDELPPNNEITWVRRWDLAASAMTANQAEPDFTASCLMGLHKETWTYYIADMTVWWQTPAETLKDMLRINKQDQAMYGRSSAEGRVKIRFEQEPGASSEFVVDYFAKEFKGHDIEGVKTGGRNKVERAKPLSKDFQNGKVKMIRGTRRQSMPNWIAKWWKYASQFPKKGVKDDPVDGASGAHFDLNEVGEFSCMVDPSARYASIEVNKTNFNKNQNISIKDINLRERHL